MYRITWIETDIYDFFFLLKASEISSVSPNHAVLDDITDKIRQKKTLGGWNGIGNGITRVE